MPNKKFGGGRMGKYRVFEIAKEFDTTSKVIIDILSRNDVQVKNHMSSVDDDVRKIVVKTFERKADKPSVKVNISTNTGTTTAQHAANTNNLKGSDKINNEKSIKQVAVKNDRPVDLKQQPHNNNHVAVVSTQKPQQRSNVGQSFAPNTTNNRYQGQKPNNNFQQRPAGDRNSRPNVATSGPVQQGQRPQQQNNMTGDSRNTRTGGNFISHKPQNPQQSGGTNRPMQQGGANRPVHQTTAGKPGGFGQPKTAKPTQQASKPVRPQTNDFNKKPQNKGRSENKPPIQGSYATKGSRPMHSQNHMGRSNKRSGMAPKAVPQKVVDIVKPTRVEIAETINVKEFADLIKREVSEVIKHLFMLGVMVTINQNIDFETAVLVGSEFNVEVVALPPE